MAITDDNIHERITRSTVTRERIAQAMGVSPAMLSRMLNGLRAFDDAMVARATAALDRLEAAEEAAEEAANEARARVLAEGV